MSDLIAIGNSDWAGLHRDVDPEDYRLAEVTLAWFHTHVGVERRTKGAHAADIAGDLLRRVPLTCVWLTHADAAIVSDGAGIRGDSSKLRATHDLRAALITDLNDDSVDGRVARWYTGHEIPTGQTTDMTTATTVVLAPSARRGRRCGV